MPYCEYGRFFRPGERAGGRRPDGGIGRGAVAVAEQTCGGSCEKRRVQSGRPRTRSIQRARVPASVGVQQRRIGEKSGIVWRNGVDRMFAGNKKGNGHKRLPGPAGGVVPSSGACAVLGARPGEPILPAVPDIGIIQGIFFQPGRRTARRRYRAERIATESDRAFDHTPRQRAAFPEQIKPGPEQRPIAVPACLAARPIFRRSWHAFY